MGGRLMASTLDLAPEVKVYTMAMAQKHTIEIYSAGCGTCREAVDLVKRVAGSEHALQVLDMQRPEVSSRAMGLGIKRVPAVVIDGKLAECCTETEHGVTESVIRAALA